MHLAFVGVVAAGLALGASAAPALASDGLDPVVPPIVVPEVVAPEVPPPPLSAPAAQEDEGQPAPELGEPPIVIDTRTIGDTFDVSVRILSPETAEKAAPESGVVEVIPAASESDITPDPAPASEPAAQTGVTERPANTNVSVRILSPGKDAVLSQITDALEPMRGPGGEDASGSPTPDATPRAGDSAVEGDESRQYQDDNSRYQSAEKEQNDSWRWEWYLTLDCSGVTSSESTEAGDSSSNNWEWIWIWNWECGLDGASEEAGAALNAGLGSIASVSGPAQGTSAPSNGPSAQAAPLSEPTGARSAAADTPSGDTNPPAGSTEAPWAWNWAFNFCGYATTLPIRAGANTPLQWSWEWAWAWACTNATTQPPATGGVGGESGEPATSTGEGAQAPELSPAPLVIEVIAPFAPGVFTAMAPTTLVGPYAGPYAAHVPTSIVISRPSRAFRSPPTRSGPGAPTAAAAGPDRSSVPIRVAVAVISRASAAGTTTDEPEERARPSKPRARKAAPRPDRGPDLPLAPTRSTSGLTGSSGSAPPSATGGSGAATLAAFFIFAAPGLGRRLRDARELSPRTPYRAPLDRPG